jgi:hypothetical protein
MHQQNSIARHGLLRSAATSEWRRVATLLAIASALSFCRSQNACAESVEMPLGALICKTVDPTIEHAKLVRQPTTAGLREFVEAHVAKGECRVIGEKTTVTVLDVDGRGYALVEDIGHGQGWTDAENLWGYFDTPAKLKAWKRP